MKKRLPILAASVLVTASTLPAANIGWVSFHAADNTPSAAAATAGFTTAPDIGYTALLAANGHTVTRFVTIPNIQDDVTGLVASLNTNDLVIIGRSVDSGHYDTDPERAVWNGLTVPVISMGGYVNRAVRLGYHTGDTINDNNFTNEFRLRVLAPIHPIFTGISLDTTDVMVNPYSRRVTFTNATTSATTLQNGISAVSNPLIPGGSVLAVAGTPGDGINGRTIIAEFPPGINDYHTNLIAARRLIFLSGSRESGITSQGAGIFDLWPDGATMFLNAVNYLGTPQAPKCTLEPVGATNLVAGDAWTLTARPSGTDPLYYQWYKDGQPLTTGTTPALAFPSLVAADGGEYYLIVTNSVGSATSTVARLEFMVPGTASITNSLIAYWPLDSIVGSKTPDLVSGYDLTLNNVTPTNILAGRWNNAFGFYNASSSALGRVNNPGEALPIYQHPNFTVSFWVQGPTTLYQSSADHRVFCEANSFSNAPMFSIGTHNATATDGTVDIFIRNDANVTAPNHQHSVAAPYTDYLWHNVVYVQRDVGYGNIRAQLWIDGALDSVVVPAAKPLTANTTALGALLRGSYQAFFDGSLDEVALWDRALTSEEVAILQLTSMTNPPVRTLPLAINTFKADLPAVPAGSTNVLRWDVSKDASVISISDIGDVTSLTTAGAGLRVITNSQATIYVLTVQRGSDILSATTTVAAVEGVAPGWNLLENFDRYTPGSLSAQGYWNNPGGTSVQVVDLNGNPSVRTVAGNSVGFLPLYGWSLREGQFRTLFYRLIPGTETSINTTNMAGITDKSQRDFADAYQNIGPFLYASAFTNDTAAITTNAWYVGARNGYDVMGDNTTAAITYSDPNLTVGAYPLQAGVVYNIWIDITNASLATYESDIFSVYIQKDGDASRTLLFQNYFSDRDPIYSDAVLGAAGPTLDKLVVLGNNGTAANNAYFDDFYLSTSGYNATVPRPYGNTGRQPATLSIDWQGTQLRIQFGSGTLQQSTDLTNWTDVNGNPPSPYLVTPTGTTVFFRTR